MTTKKILIQQRKIFITCFLLDFTKYLEQSWPHAVTAECVFPKISSTKYNILQMSYKSSTIARYSLPSTVADNVVKIFTASPPDISIHRNYTMLPLSLFVQPFSKSNKVMLRYHNVKMLEILVTNCPVVIQKQGYK